MNAEQQTPNVATETTPKKESRNELETRTPENEHTIVPWDDYFMFLALLSAKRSKDPVTQVGACIVDDENRIVAIGYNGFPRNCHDDAFPWGKSKQKMDNKKMYVVHAEANAILNKNSASVNGMRLFSTLFPCNECAKLIIQSGVGAVYFLSDKYEDRPEFKASKRMFDATGIKYIQLKPKHWRVELDFGKMIEEDPSSPFKKLQLISPQATSAKEANSAATLGRKRLRYVEWDDYFMAMALLSAKRSKDPENQVGACIVDSQQRIVANGYNGFPRNCSDNEFPWGRSTDEMYDKKTYVVHAEANAILNKNSASVNGMRLFTTLFPCNECAKLIIQSGIGTVYFLSDKYEDKARYRAAKRMFDAAGVVYKRFKPSWSSIQLDIGEVISADPCSPLKQRKLDFDN